MVSITSPDHCQLIVCFVAGVCCLCLKVSSLLKTLNILLKAAVGSYFLGKYVLLLALSVNYHLLSALVAGSQRQFHE